MIVTQLPLHELWRDDGFSTTARRKALTPKDVKQLLAPGLVQVRCRRSCRANGLDSGLLVR